MQRFGPESAPIYWFFIGYWILSEAGCLSGLFYAQSLKGNLEILIFNRCFLIYPFLISYSSFLTCFIYFCA